MSTGLLVVSLLIMIFFEVYNINALNGLTDSTRTTSGIEKSVLILRSNEKGFLAHTQMSYVDSFNETADHIEKQTVLLKTIFDSQALNLNTLNSFQAEIKEYRTKFALLVELQKKLA
jgi:CHASE3 domain sensor protein